MKKAIFYSLLFIFAACEGPEGPQGPAGTNSLVAIVDEAAGANCDTGGVKITTGIDVNANNTLDAAEVTQTRYVCNGEAGSGSGPKEIRLADFDMYSKLNQVNDYTTIVYADFDIANFPGYNSVQFVLKGITVTDDNDDPSTIEYVIDAIDASDEGAIAGSAVTVNEGNYVSPNFYDNIPTGKFDIGIRAHQKDAGPAQLAGVGYLVISKVD